MRELLNPERLFDMSKSIAAAIFADVGYPWEVLPEIGAFSAFPSASQQFFQSSVLFPAWLRSTDSSLCIWLLTSTTSVFLRTATAYLFMQPVLPFRAS